MHKGCSICAVLHPARAQTDDAEYLNKEEDPETLTRAIAFFAPQISPPEASEIATGAFAER